LSKNGDFIGIFPMDKRGGDAGWGDRAKCCKKAVFADTQQKQKVFVT
jgi:hypothetical protein